MIISLISRKGGVGRSTSAMYVAALLEAGDRPSAVVDLDPEGTALSWSRLGTLSFPVYPAEEIKTAITSGREIVVDTPPNDPETLGQAAAIADRVIVVARTNPLEADRLRPTLDALEASGYAGHWGVLLTQAPAGTLGESVQEALATAGLPVLGIIPSRVVYQRAFGHQPQQLHDYAAAIEGFL